MEPVCLQPVVVWWSQLMVHTFQKKGRSNVNVTHASARGAAFEVDPMLNV